MYILYVHIHKVRLIAMIVLLLINSDRVNGWDIKVPTYISDGFFFCLYFCLFFVLFLSVTQNEICQPCKKPWQTVAGQHMAKTSLCTLWIFEAIQ